MLSEETIRRALHASRVAPLKIANPHGPLGLEQLAAAVAAYRESTPSPSSPAWVRRPIELPLRTWEKLHALAVATSQERAHPISTGELAAAIIEQYMLDAAS